MIRIAGLLACLMMSTQALLANDADLCSGPGPAFGPLYEDAAFFHKALEATQDVPTAFGEVSGVIVPHHLEVPDLVAGGLRLAKARDPKRIVVLLPDHFKQSTSAISTTERDFETILGPVETDKEGVRALLAHSDLVRTSCMFDVEHGLLALLPFIANLYPDAKIIPVAFDLRTGPDDWHRMIEILRPLLDDDSLVVQSTDFSHYLPHHVARQRDQQVLNILAAQDLALIAKLKQPVHVDSIAAFYTSMALQRDHFDASPIVFANMNQQERSDRFIEETTSYVVAAFVANPGSSPDTDFGEAQRLVVGGDLFVGRVIPPLLLDELLVEGLVDAVQTATGGAELLLNLEGVLLPKVPGNLPHLTLGMPGDLFVRLAERLNIRAVSLANNHANDLGDVGLRETRTFLDKASVLALEQGQPTSLMGAKIIGFTDLTGSDTVRLNLLTPEKLDAAIEPDATTPVIAFMHWGEEFKTDPGERQRWLSDQLRQRGVSLIIGAHPHAASDEIEILGGGETAVFYSLGNFLFDQTSDDSSGALVEVKIFPQGTLFARYLPLPHLFDIISNDASH